MKERRIVWMDYAKSIGIFLVIAGHTALPQSIINTIYTFHMPLFFFLSGYLFQEKKFRSFKEFFLKRFRQLVVPYFILNFILYALWLTRAVLVSSEIDVHQMIVVPIFSIFYGTAAIDGFLIHCIPMWFIACLFTVELLYFVSKAYKKFLLPLYWILGFADYYWSAPILPWCIDIALTAILFFWFGNFFRSVGVPYLKRLGLMKGIALFILAVVCLGYVIQNNGRVDMGSRHYGNYALFLLGAIAGTLVFLGVIWCIALLFKRRGEVEYFSNNTIVVIAFHSAFLLPVRTALLTIFNKLGTIPDLILLAIMVSLIVTAIMFIIIYVLNRFFPVAIGKGSAGKEKLAVGTLNFYQKQL